MSKIIILLISVIVGGIVYVITNYKKTPNNYQSKSSLNQNSTKTRSSNYNTNDSLSYPEKLNKTKELYPFKNWREAYFEYEMEQYTEENCNTAKKIFDDLINGLINLGENASEKNKIILFEKAIKDLNSLSNKDESIIETGEREDLCELIDQITLASGLDPNNYANGKGIADLWREW